MEPHLQRQGLSLEGPPGMGWDPCKHHGRVLAQPSSPVPRDEVLDAPKLSFPTASPGGFPHPAPPGWPNLQWAAGRAGNAAGSRGARPPAQGETGLGMAVPRARSCCPLPVPMPTSYRLAQLGQHWDEAQQLLVLQVPRPLWHRDPVGSLGGQGEGWIPHSHGAPGDWDTRIPLWSPTWAGKPCMVWSRATVLARSLPRRVRSFQ